MRYHLTLISALLLLLPGLRAADTPNVVLLMTDDQGWGQMGYRDHPILKTPNLDAMAKNGLRFERFYAGASNCSPTRATVLSGRSNDRTGVYNHGYPMDPREKTISEALQGAGYATAHFGKWHLNGLRGPGAPILANDLLHPGIFGFDYWLSATNYIDLDPMLGDKDGFEDLKGDSSDVIVDHAIKFIRDQVAEEKPFFTVIWYGSPHSPMDALEKDKAAFSDLEDGAQNHYAELVAVDRSVGTLRAALRELDVVDNTIVWYNSDNGGLQGYGPETVGGLRGWKNTMYEGGLRVPCVVEWPAGIPEPRITSFPSCTMDIFPTIADAVGLSDSVFLEPLDGISLKPLFAEEIETREKPITFRHQGRLVVIDGDDKLIIPSIDKPAHELYDLGADHAEETDLSAEKPELASRLRAHLEAWNESVEASVAGEDYSEPRPEMPERRFWHEDPDYEPFMEDWADHPRFGDWIRKRRQASN